MDQWEANVSQARKRKAGAFDPLDAPSIAYLAEAFRVETLEQDDAARWSLGERQLYRSTKAALETHGVFYRPSWADAEGRRWALKARESLEASLPEYRRLKAEGDLDGIVDEWREEALDLAEARGLTVNPDDAEGLARLCRALNDAAIRASQARLRRLDGEDVPTPPEPVRQASQEVREHQTVAPSRVPLLKLYDDYSASAGMTSGVRVEWRKYIERLIEFLGHDDASRITADDLRRWRDHLLTEPTRQNTPRSPVTVRDKYITSLRATLAYGVDEGRLGLSGAATPVAVDQAGYSGNFVVLSDGVNRSCFGRCPQGMQKVAAPTWGTRILAEDPAAVIQAFLLAVRNLSFVQEADGVPICQGATSLTITSDKARLSWRRREARDSARRPDRYSDSLARNRKRQSRTPASRHGLPPWCLPRRRALRAPKVSTRLPAPSN